MNFLFGLSDITKFFEANTVAKILVDAYLSLLVISFVVYLCIKFKKALHLTLIGLLLLSVYFVSREFGFNLSSCISLFSSFIFISFEFLCEKNPLILFISFVNGFIISIIKIN